jgi:hypothetical protein
MTLPRVTVLGSGVALGVYVPALLVERQLERRGVPAETLVIESLYTEAGISSLERCRVAYQRQFELARLAHRMTRAISPVLDEDAVDELLACWSAEDRRHFAIWSGFWLPVIDRYRRMVRRPLHVDLCRIDAKISVTFRVYQHLCDELGGSAREVWLWNLERNALDVELPVSDAPPLPWDAREDRLVIHGGGWGLGTYQEHAAELRARGFSTDLVLRDASDAESTDATRCFMVDPSWRAWRDPEMGFPPFGEVGAAPRFTRRETHHELYELVKNCRAIVSKPGGGTLIDSLASATPVVLLDSYGYAEDANAAMWERLGFGIRWERWCEAGFSMDLIADLHRNLLQRRHRGADYPAVIAASLREHVA